MGCTFLLKNSAGKPDGMFTMAWILFVILCVYATLGLIGGSEFTFTAEAFTTTIRIPGFQWEIIPAFLTAVYAYVVRRNRTDSIDTADEAHFE